MTPNSECFGETARTSQMSPLSAVTIAPAAWHGRRQATSLTSSSTFCGTEMPAGARLPSAPSRAPANRTTLRCMTVAR